MKYLFAQKHFIPDLSTGDMKLTVLIKQMVIRVFAPGYSVNANIFFPRNFSRMQKFYYRYSIYLNSAPELHFNMKISIEYNHLLHIIYPLIRYMIYFQVLNKFARLPWFLSVAALVNKSCNITFSADKSLHVVPCLKNYSKITISPGLVQRASRWRIAKDCCHIKGAQNIKL